MKKLFFLLTALLSIGSVVTSCSNDNASDSNQPATRSYVQDAELLMKFVDVDKAEGLYYINDNKKITALSYITDKDWQELQKVDPANRTIYENELMQLNAQLENVAKNGAVSQIVYSTYGETWVRNIGEDFPFTVETKDYTPNVTTKAQYGAWVLDPDMTVYMSFNGNANIRSDIRMNLFGSMYYFFEIICQIKATKTGSYPGEGGNNPKSVVFSGVSSFENYSFLWKTVSGLPSYWDFQGIQHSPGFGKGTINVNFYD